MNWVERLLIIGGVSLDVFAAMEREGSLVAKIEKKGLLSVCFLVCAWQAAALYAGNLAAAVILEKERSVWSLAVPGNGIMLAAFTWLGMHLAAGALHRERIYEHRAERFNRNGILRAMVRAGGYMLLAGGAFGLLGTDAAAGMVLAVCVSAAAVIAGAYTGYCFGAPQKGAAYAAGAVLMWGYGVGIWLTGK